jgi:L-ascorbate metabolism protein UlaG (beta-lactamase superfamily)
LSKLYYNSKLDFWDNVPQKGMAMKGVRFYHPVYMSRLKKDLLVKWITTPNPQKVEKKTDTFKLNLIQNKISDIDKDSIVWFGHCTFFIQLNGVRMITDPIFYDLGFYLKRKMPIPTSTQYIYPLDYVLISHGHRDHLDKKSVLKIQKINPEVKFLCPLEIGAILKGWGIKHVEEASWYQIFNTHKVQITYLPAKHWNRRYLHDLNQTLWGSFAISDGKTSIYFSGDTGYQEHFQEINSILGDFDYCLLPIGTYKPFYMMQESHMNPYDSFKAFEDLGGKGFIPMHYSTFDLSEEPPSEPLKIITEVFEINKRSEDFKNLIIGEELKI